MGDKKVSVTDILLKANDLIHDATVNWALDKGAESDGVYYICGINDLCNALIELVEKCDG